MLLHNYRSKHTPYRHGPGALGAYQYLFRFENGYGASLIVGGAAAYGGLELAVIRFANSESDKFELTYDTPISSDVEGYLSGPDEVEDLLDSIKTLPRITLALYSK